MKLLLNVIAFVIILVAFCSKGHSQQKDSISDYYPLQFGNKWQYSWHEGFNDIKVPISIETDEIVGDTLLPNGQKYFQLRITYDYPRTGDSSTHYVVYPRVDSTSGSVLEYSSLGPEVTLFVAPRLNTIDTLLGRPTSSLSTANDYRHEVVLVYGLGIIRMRNVNGVGRWWNGRLLYANVNGNEIGSVYTSVKETQWPTRMLLYQNYPNPFNPTTTISYELPRASNVKLTVYDVLGREVQTLVNELKQPGRYQVTFNATNLASGMYVYRLQAGSFVQTRKLLLVR